MCQKSKISHTYVKYWPCPMIYLFCSQDFQNIQIFAYQLSKHMIFFLNFDTLLNKLTYPNQRLPNGLSLPFGFGPRMCIGRRLAELSMQILLLRLSQAYRIENQTKNVNCISLLINQPDQPIHLKFIKKK